MDKKQILIIDDEIGPRESLRILLKDDHTVTVTESPAAGLELLERRRPDLVIIDLKMPEMNGIELLRRIRQREPALKVFVLTGYSTPETVREAESLGVSAYLNKPFDIFELRRLITATLAGER